MGRLYGDSDYALRMTWFNGLTVPHYAYQNCSFPLNSYELNGKIRLYDIVFGYATFVQWKDIRANRSETASPNYDVARWPVLGKSCGLQHHLILSVR